MITGNLLFWNCWATCLPPLTSKPEAFFGGGGTKMLTLCFFMEQTARLPCSPAVGLGEGSCKAGPTPEKEVATWVSSTLFPPIPSNPSLFHRPADCITLWTYSLQPQGTPSWFPLSASSYDLGSLFMFLRGWLLLIYYLQDALLFATFLLCL